MSEANKELVRRHVEELWNRQDLAVADELMAQDYLEHALAPFRVEGGRLAEHWATREVLVAMLQLGVVQPPGRPPS